MSEQTHWTLTVGDEVLPVYDFGTTYYHGDQKIGMGFNVHGILSGITLGVRDIPHGVYTQLEGAKVTLRGPDGIEASGRVLVTEAERRGLEPCWRAEMSFRPDSWAALREQL